MGPTNCNPLKHPLAPPAHPLLDNADGVDWLWATLDPESVHDTLMLKQVTSHIRLDVPGHTIAAFKP